MSEDLLRVERWIPHQHFVTTGGPDDRHGEPDPRARGRPGDRRAGRRDRATTADRTGAPRTRAAPGRRASAHRGPGRAARPRLGATPARAGGCAPSVEELRTHEQDRRASDGEQREVVKRLATVLAGGASKGRAGEFILREHLAELPPGMLVTDFRVNGKVVEFGLLLPDGRRLPIDSKWSAV